MSPRERHKGFPSPARNRLRAGFSYWRTEKKAPLPHACCGAVKNVCCDVSALREALFKLSPAPPNHAKPWRGAPNGH
jgi:hypothetical protein